ncbi:MAG: hypothetical protein FJX75_11830 [Armatimonadetes bacterium]|nr:hypothetical protein [Armatimonadota bacterium]
MLPMVMACLMCLPHCGAAGTALPALDDAAPVEQAQVDRYDLTATYDPSPAGQVALILERADERNLLLVRSTGKRIEIVRVADGKSARLATGAGVSVTNASELTVRRRPGTVAVFSGDRALVEAHVDFRPGACGSVAGAARPSDLRLQEIGEITLDDDFFVGEPREGLWENLLGAFKIDIYWDPKQKVDNRPIGACWFANDGPGEHLAATGADFWDDYACEVSARPAADSAVGLAFRVQDKANYAILVLSCESGGNTARLVEVRNGTARTLAETQGDWPPGHWQRLRIEVVGPDASAFVSGQPAGTGTLSGAPSGRAGVYAKTGGDCRFDDLSVRGLRRLEADAQPQPAGPWRFAHGAWQSKGQQLTCRAASTAVAVASVGEWTDADVRANVRLPAAGEAGVLVRWSPEGGYAFLTRKAGADLSCRLARVGADGSFETLSGAKAPLTAEGPALGLTSSGPALRGFVNGVCVVRAWDGRLVSGEVGVVVSGGQASFADFAASEPNPEDLVSELLADGTDQSRPGADSEVFEPFIGQLWRPGSGRAGLTSVDGEPAIALNHATLRYYSPRPGDVSLAADLLRTDDQPVSLTICSDATRELGYSLTFTGPALQLTRNGQPVAEASAPTRLPLSLSLRRDGPFVIGRAGETVVSYRDPEPLPSGDALVSAAGQAIIDNLELGAAHALAYRFDRVEPDWVETSGEWLFHSGMACIPWDYWLTGDGRETPAVAWNRRQAPADLCVRFDVSQYTEGYESGQHQHFAYHDISLALSGDGADLDSGYRFLVGAEGGRGTRLFRKGQLVAETTDPRFSSTARAIEVIATKSGGSVTLWLNGVQALTYEDPEALGAGRVALGVEKCRANFRDLFLYRDETWTQPLGATAFSPEPTQ